MATPYRKKLKPGEAFYGGGKGVIVRTVVPVKPVAKPEAPPTERKQ
jgi:hypothetical protein